MKFLYGATSAFLLNLALFLPNHFTWAVLLFMVPLFYALLSGYRLRFKEGALWGAFYYGIHFIVYFQLAQEHAYGAFRGGIYFFLCTYFSLLSGLWFLGLDYFRRSENNLGRACLMIMITLCYYYVLFYYSLYIFGSRTGYSLSMPLLPFMTRHYGALLIAYFGCWPVLGLVLMINYCIACWYHTKKYFLLGISVAAMIVLSLKTQQQSQALEWLAGCAYINPPPAGQPPLSQAQEVTQAIVALKERMPQLHTIFMPESAFSCALNEQHEVIDCLWLNALQGEIVLIAGAMRAVKNDRYNSFFCIQNNRISHYYDKTFYMPFTEFTPWPWSKIRMMRHLFLSGKDVYCVGKCSDNQRLFWLHDQFFVQPAICSDIFFNTHFVINTEATAVIFLANDYWFSMPYYKRLLLLYAQFFAANNQISMIYATGSAGYYIDAFGRMQQLNS